MIDKINTRYATILIANSKFSQNKLQKIYDKKFHLLYMGVNSNIFKYGKQTRSKKYFLTVGSTSIFKGIDFLMQ